MDPLERIRTLLTSDAVRRVEQGIDVWELSTGPWWKLFTGYQGLDDAKQQLLSATWELPGALFFAPQFEPVGPELAPYLIQHDPGVWVIDRERSPAGFYNAELEEGNWALYVAERPVAGRIPNTFKTAPQALAAFLREHRVVLLIDSFYDDAEWRVALAQLVEVA